MVKGECEDIDINKDKIKIEKLNEVIVVLVIKFKKIKMNGFLNLYQQIFLIRSFILMTSLMILLDLMNANIKL